VAAAAEAEASAAAADALDSAAEAGVATDVAVAPPSITEKAPEAGDASIVVELLPLIWICCELEH
jgi:hypothetical protein